MRVAQQEDTQQDPVEPAAARVPAHARCLLNRPIEPAAGQGMTEHGKAGKTHTQQTQGVPALHWQSVAASLPAADCELEGQL